MGTCKKKGINHIHNCKIYIILVADLVMKYTAIMLFVGATLADSAQKAAKCTNEQKGLDLAINRFHGCIGICNDKFGLCHTAKQNKKCHIACIRDSLINRKFIIAKTHM